MDFLDPKKKRAHAIRLMVGYCLMAVVLFTVALFLLLASLGYGFNRKTGEVTLNGLVFVDAHPERARMYIDGQDKGESDGRFVLEAGKYNLELRRDGYRTWKRDFELAGGNIVRLVYPFLFPEKLNSKDLTTFASLPDVVTVSPDRHWIISHRPEALTTFEITDASTKENRTTSITLPAAVLGSHTGQQRFEMTEWSTDNRHVLLKYTYDGGYDYIVLDRENAAESYSVSQTFGRPFTSVTLLDKKFDQLYVYDANGGVLQSANVRDKTLAPVATRVQAFWPYKASTVLYATDLDAPAGKALIKIKEGQVAYTIREVVLGTNYLLNMAEFDSDLYVGAGSVADGKVYLYKNPLTALKKVPPSQLVALTILRVDNPEYLAFSANTRFISVQGGSRFAIYDAETKNSYKYDTGLPIVAGQKATWMDGHRLMLVSDNKLVVFDYDNVNRQTLVGANPAFIPMFDRDFNNLFTVGPTVADATKTGLVKTDLNLGED